jgi:hypothetical protein
VLCAPSCVRPKNAISYTAETRPQAPARLQERPRASTLEY